MQRLFYTIIFILALMPSAVAALNDSNLVLLKKIESAFADVERQKDIRRAEIDSLMKQRGAMESSLNRVDLTDKIGDMYRMERIDSALHFWRLAGMEATKLQLTDKSIELKMKYLSHFPLIGPGVEAVNEFGKIDIGTLSPDLRKNYWYNVARLLFYVQASFPDGEKRQRYRRRTITAIDSVLPSLNPAGPEYSSFTGMRYLMHEDESMAVATLLETLPKIGEASEGYDIVMKVIFDYYSKHPDAMQHYIGKLLEYNITYLKRGIVKSKPLAEAGCLLYENGYKRTGKNLMLSAMSNPDTNETIRSEGFSRYIRYLNDRSTVVRTWMAVAAAVMLAIIIALTSILIVWKHRHERTVSALKERIDKAERSTVELNRVVDGIKQLMYVSHDILTESNTYINRKLKTGQVKDLFNEIGDGTFAGRQKDQFFTAFDSIFLSFFPDFVEQLNKLFTPGKELEQLPGNRLTPELRIAAYMRLGITDAQKLSEQMNLSINTIYTYRNRLRGRAADRENFEKNVLDLHPKA